MTSARRVLLVEDEPSLSMTLSDRLRAEGYQVVAVESGEEALVQLDDQAFDLMILDILLPGIDGLEVCRQARGRDHHVPIMMLTARGQTDDKVAGLKLGADDYVTKPFEHSELLARVEALLRRAHNLSQVPDTFVFGDVRMDFRRAEVRRGGEVVDLSSLEYKLLGHFVRHRGELQTRDRLLDEVWGYKVSLATRTVDVHVASLRQKIEPLPAKPQFIVTVHGLGYRFAG